MRFADFGRLLDAGAMVRDRLLHGSDFPFPASPIEFAEKIGQQVAMQIDAEPNLLRKDFALKVALGIRRASAERAYELVIDGQR